MNETDIVKIILGLLGPVSGVVVAILILALLGLGIYLRRYLEQKALQLATREDFTKLQTQVAESTRMVESIKSELANSDWVRRELHVLRVKKIEELVTLALNCEDDLVAQRNSAIDGTYYDKPKHYDRMLSVATVYLPELEPAARAYRLEVLKHSQQILKKGLEASGGSGHSVWNNFFENSNYTQMTTTLDALKTQAARLLQETASGTVFNQIR